MPSEPTSDRRALLAWAAVRDNIRLAQEFTEGMTPEAFAGNRMVFYAVTRCLEIISEAARRLRGDAPGSSGDRSKTPETSFAVSTKMSRSFAS